MAYHEVDKSMNSKRWEKNFKIYLSNLKKFQQGDKEIPIKLNQSNELLSPKPDT